MSRPMSHKKGKAGDLRVWWNPQVGRLLAEVFYVRVKTPVDGKFVLETLANYDLYQLENNVKPDYSNTGGLKVFEDDGNGNLEWVDWQGLDGSTIDDVEFGDVGEYDMIPDRILRAINAHVRCGQQTGHFVTAVLSNDLQAAIMRADEESMSALRQIAMYVYNRCPSGCWGSLSEVNAWRESGGSEGLEKAGEHYDLSELIEPRS